MKHCLTCSCPPYDAEAIAAQEPSALHIASAISALELVDRLLAERGVSEDASLRHNLAIGLSCIRSSQPPGCEHEWSALRRKHECLKGCGATMTQDGVVNGATQPPLLTAQQMDALRDLCSELDDGNPHYVGHVRTLKAAIAALERTDQSVKARAEKETAVARTEWTKTSDSDPYCIHCGKTWDMHLCDGFSSCPTANRGV